MSRYTKSMTDALRQVDDRTQEFDEAVKWEVKITGLPTFYSDGKSRGEVKQALRKLLKRPDDIVSIERTTPAALKKIRRGQAAGTEPGDGEEAEKVKEEVKINRIIEAQSVDDVINMIQFGHPFKVVEEIPAELPGPEVPRYKNASNATVDKEDKKANKIKDKAEKGTLIPTQTKENKLPDHLAKFLDKKGNPNKEAQARIDAGRKKREEPKIKDVTPKGYGPSEDVEIDEGPPTPKFKPLKHKVWSADASIPTAARGTGKIGKPAKYKVKKSGMGSGPPTNEEVEMDEWGDTSILSKQQSRISGRPDIRSIDHKEDPRKLKITQQGLDALRKDRDRPKVKTQLKITKKGREALDKDKKNQNKPPVGPQHEMAERLLKKLREVAPPGWGHTKAEYEKTKPNKPKSKIGGTAHEFDKDLKSGKFKGLPGDKTMKDKRASMFKIMWSQKNKGDTPHYKPGEKDKLKSKYKKEENILEAATRYVIDERADWETAFKSASQSRPAMKYKDAAAFIETAGLNSSEKRTALKSAKKWLK